jgi:hypothetical protein
MLDLALFYNHLAVMAFEALLIILFGEIEGFLGKYYCLHLSNHLYHCYNLIFVYFNIFHSFFAFEVLSLQNTNSL